MDDTTFVMCAEEAVRALLAARPEIVDSLPDESLARMAPYMAPWADGTAYKAGDRVGYGMRVFRCLQDHESQETWNPEDAPSLWAKVGDPTEEFPAWSQPIGSHDAYMSGDKVAHKDQNWISTIGNNVWEPGVYGWEVVQQS